jgi:hypothetical protein
VKDYRVKHFLEDGRVLYASKRGELETITEDRKETVLAEAGKAAYSKDLITFSSVDYFETLEMPCVKVVSVVLEPADDPLDEKAIIRPYLNFDD